MADKIRVKVLKQKVFHDGLSMVVLKPGSEKVDPKHLRALLDEGVIANPGAEALRRAAASSGYTDAGETQGPGDDSSAQPIGAFTEEQERNLAEQSQALAGDDDDDVEALHDRIAELEDENEDLRRQVSNLQQSATIKGEVVEGGAPLGLGTKIDGGVSQLDHDQNGSPDGSTAQAGDELPALRDEYEKLAGKRVFNGWDADTVRAKIAELKASDDADQSGIDDAGDEDGAPPA